MELMCSLSRVLDKINANAMFKHAFILMSLLSVFLLWQMSSFLKLPFLASAIFKQLEHRRSFRNFFHSPSLNDSSLNYAIFDASNHACAELDFLKRVPRMWMVLLLNDCEEGLAFKSCPRCVPLPQSWVREHVYDKLASKIPEAEDEPLLTRMAAALYVTSLGASWVFFADRKVPIPFSALRRITEKEVPLGLIYNPPSPGTMFEPCGHFMDPYTWQKQLPLTDPSLYNLASISPYSVYHVIRECTEETRLSSPSQDNLDLRAPPPYVGNRTFVVSDLNNLLVPVHQLWSLLPAIISFPVKFQVSPLDQPSFQASLSVLVQRVLWETGGHFGFLPALVQRQAGMSSSVPKENQNDKEGPAFSERDGAANASNKTACNSCEVRNSIRAREGRFFQDLINWDCASRASITQCLDSLANRELSLNRFDQHMVRYVSIWTQLLRMHNRDGPHMTNTTLEYLTVSPVYFSPASTRPKKTPENRGQIAKDLCLVRNKKNFSIFLSKHVITDVLLVVVMNYPFLVTNIPFLDHAYGRHFKHILYCAESVDTFEQKYLRVVQNQPVSFIQQRLNYGRQGHACVTAAIAMGYDVSGFLEMADDVALNVWNFHNLPRAVPWFQSSVRVAHIDQTSVPDFWMSPEWEPWTLPLSGRKAALSFFQHLQSLHQDQKRGHLVVDFLESLSNFTDCDRCVAYEASDIFYVPASIASQFYFLSSLTLQHQLHIEIAVPTLLAGLTTGQVIYRLRGQYLWKNKRRLMLSSFSSHDHFLHDFRLSNVGKLKRLKFFCEIFLRRIDKDLIQLHKQKFDISRKEKTIFVPQL